MKKTSGNWKVYFWGSYMQRWELSGNTGLHGKNFVTKEKAEKAILKYGATEVYYKAATKKPASSIKSNQPFIVH